MYEYENNDIIDADNGISPTRHRGINRTSGSVLLIGHVGISLIEIRIEEWRFSLTNEFDIAVCKMASICHGVLHVCCALCACNIIQ